jgi:hypothetical protein
VKVVESPTSTVAFNGLIVGTSGGVLVIPRLTLRIVVPSVFEQLNTYVPAIVAVKVVPPFAGGVIAVPLPPQSGVPKMLQLVASELTVQAAVTELFLGTSIGPVDPLRVKVTLGGSSGGGGPAG